MRNRYGAGLWAIYCDCIVKNNQTDGCDQCVRTGLMPVPVVELHGDMLAEYEAARMQAYIFERKRQGILEMVNKEMKEDAIKAKEQFMMDLMDDIFPTT